MSTTHQNLDQARSHLKQRNFAAALSLADSVVAMDGNCVEALQLRGQALFHLGRDAEAIQALREIHAVLHRGTESDDLGESDYLLPLPDDDEESAARLGLLLADDQVQAEEVLELLQALRVRYRLDADLLGLLAEMAELAGRYDVAREALEEIIEEDPARVEAWETLVHLLAREDLDGAQAMLTQALRYFPAHPLFYEFYGFIHYRRRQFRLAIDAYRQAIKLSNEQPDPYQALAQCYLAMGDTGAVLDLLRQLIERWPDDVETQQFVIEVAIQLDHLALAQNAGNQLLRLQPSHPDTYCYRALVEIARRDWEAAERCLRLGFHKAVDGPVALFNLVDLLLESDDLEDGLLVSNLACELAPEHPEAHAARGKIFREMGAFTDAQDAFRFAASLAPLDDTYQTWQGVVLDNMEQYPEAIRIFDAVLARHPDDVWTLCNRGLSYLSLGLPDRAHADFARGISHDPHDAPLYFWRACAYAQSGHTAEALADLGRALDLSDEIHTWLEEETSLDPLRNNPRFRQLLYPDEDDE